jgi:hypothetical protein
MPVERFLDAHLKMFPATATAGWVAVVLEHARVVEIDRARPACVRLLDRAVVAGVLRLRMHTAAELCALAASLACGHDGTTERVGR